MAFYLLHTTPVKKLMIIINPEVSPDFPFYSREDFSNSRIFAPGKLML